MAKITEELLVRENEIRDKIEIYADLFDLDPNLIRGLITQESRFVAEATSPTGAYGYGQFTGIGARQVKNISIMTDKAADLADFVKQDADDPDLGVKAVCATLWWLFNKKYHQIQDKKIQLEAVLTFYNSGGRPAALVIKYGGHAQAISAINQLPANLRSQAATYAPEVAAWFVFWHEQLQKEKATFVVSIPAIIPVNPFDEKIQKLNIRYKALVETLLLVASEDKEVDSIINSRDGLTELTLIFPGEFD